MNYQHNLQRLLLQIPPGKVTTYREIAHAMDMRAYRYVGQLLHKNPHSDKFPCYKVVRANGELGGFALGQSEKIRRLKADGIKVKEGKILDFPRILHSF
jgi:methylated-DNA-[protein]-cysteine S-methyltransferase